MRSAAVEILESLDTPRFRRGFAELFHHLPQPADDAEALATMHVARTASDAVRFACRAYSHAWLLDRGMPSLLPDELRPKAERVYPVAAYGVGISVKAGAGRWRREMADTKRGFLEDAVKECDADGRLLDREHVAARLAEARTKADNYLYG